MEQRQGWERPGWFLPDNKTAPVLPYDYDGYRDKPKNTNYTYADILQTERTFNFPPHDNIVSIGVMIFAIRRQNRLKPLCKKIFLLIAKNIIERSYWYV